MYANNALSMEINAGGIVATNSSGLILMHFIDSCFQPSTAQFAVDLLEQSTALKQCAPAQGFGLRLPKIS